MVNVGNAVAYLDLDITKFNTGMASALSQLNAFKTQGAMSISSAMQTIGNSMSSAGMTMTKSLTVPLAAVGTAATVTAANFETSMSKVEAISGATADQMVQLRDKAIEMGSKTKFSAKESADAFTYMAMAGWKTEDMLEGISGIMSLAAADGLDLATTSDIVTDALTAFGLQAADSSHFADVLATASSNANTNVSMLGESFKFVGPVAGSLGLSVEDTAIALGLMANSGIKASMAGTTLRSALTNMVKPSDQMAAKMQELGINVTNADGSMMSLKDIMDILRDKFSGLTEAEQANAAATIFGKTAMSGMLAIINASEEDYKNLTKAIYGADGAADSMAATMMDNLNGAITLLKSALESLAIKIGTALTPVIRELAEFITKIVEWLNTLSDEQIQMIVKIGAVIAAIGPLLIIIGKVISAIGLIVKAVSSIGTAITAIGPIFTAVIGIGSKIFAGITAIAGFISEVLIPAIAAMNPVILIIIGAITALIAIGVALYKNWDEVKEAAGRCWEAIKETISNIAEAISNFFKEAIESIKKFIDDTKANVKEFLDSVFDGAVELFNTCLETAKTFFTNLFESISGSLKSIFDSVVSWGTSMIDKAVEVGTKFVDGIVSFFSTLPDKMMATIDSVYQRISEWGAAIVSKGTEIATSFVSGFVKFFDGLPNKVMGFIGSLVGMVTSWGSQLVSSATGIASGFANALTTGFENVANFFASTMSSIIEKIKSFGTQMFDVGKELLGKLWEGFKNVWESISSWLTDKFKAIADKMDAVISPIKNIVSSVGNFFSGSHANGLDYVPYDGYVAQLHQGERVLTKSEAKEYNDGGSSRGGDTFIFNSNEKIDEYEAARLLRKTKRELEFV